MHRAGMIQSARTVGTLSPTVLSGFRVQVAREEWRQITNGHRQLYASSSSAGLESPRLHSSPHLPRYTSQIRPQTPSGPILGPGDISDDEWNLRAGRVVYTLRSTLPNFFEAGLASRVDRDQDLGLQAASGTDDARTERPGALPPIESIYAPNIRLSYTPPTALSLPSAFPKTLQVEGLPLYHASATFIRHTLSAFNTELRVDLCKLHVHSTGRRHRDIAIRTVVSGKSRLSGSQNEWDVHSTYTLSPRSALVDLHVVESIHPAPHVTFYDGLRAALARMAGIEVGREASGGMRCSECDRNVA